MALNFGVHSIQGAEAPAGGAAPDWRDLPLTATAGDFTLDAERGIWTGMVTCRYPTGDFKDVQRVLVTRQGAIEILLPDNFDAAQPHRVLYLLSACRKLDPCLVVVKKLGLHTRLRLICVAPAMGGWYGNHASDPLRRSADYLRQAIVPLIEERYRTSGGPEGRLLLGFSKSGWGAISLILDQPDFYGYAASWDAPMMHTQDPENKGWGKIGRDATYGTVKQMLRYHPVLLARARPEPFRERARLVIHGTNFWGKQPRQFHEVLDQLGIKHNFEEVKRLAHSWDSGWLEPAIEALMEQTRRSGRSGGDAATAPMENKTE